MRGAVDGWRRGSRLALLVLLVLGVCGMHTLGHVGLHRSHGGTATPQRSHGATAAPAPADHARAGGTRPDHTRPGGTRPDHTRADPTRPDHTGRHAAGEASSAGGQLPDLDPGSVCLAVLTSLLLLIVAAARARAGRGEHTPDAAGQVAGRTARPPPRPLSLRLARVSVLRI
ncbi:hypothetical protein [Nonomuraea rhodomycinica]|uniref:Uncharacterized protein n=1 Tax=Nonomuraea rhodomycinica TaxID=1712872 RepID=A0A7Y6ISK7_9ACTN|nr:hypothetical protein [Nonomuraea rhodomycinica]NUW43602.1 hypothetical protein [Nonomuraea rhodomycinica]